MTILKTIYSRLSTFVIFYFNMGHIFVTMAVTGNYKNIQYKNIKTDEENKFVRTRSEDADAVPVINNKAGPGTAETEQLSTTGTMMTMKC